jgi:hypothetical protein
MFGFENLFLFDNGSSIPSVIDTLQEYQKKGINYDNTHNTVADYALKGEIITDCVLKMQSKELYDVVFLLDCDEFVVLKDGPGATVDRFRILDYLERVFHGQGILRVSTQFFNIINRPGEFGITDYTKSVIILDGTFLKTDHGHHFCSTTAGSLYRPCEFAYVHYHYKPLLMLREHARAKLAPFVDVDDLAAVAAFTGWGNHLRPYLTMSDAEFQNWHKGDKFYVFTEFTNKLKQLGANIPF